MNEKVEQNEVEDDIVPHEPIAAVLTKDLPRELTHFAFPTITLAILLIIASMFETAPQSHIVRDLLSEADLIQDPTLEPFRDKMIKIASLQFPVAVGLPTLFDPYKLACTKTETGDVTAWLLTKDERGNYDAQNIAQFEGVAVQARDHCTAVIDGMPAPKE